MNILLLSTGSISVPLADKLMGFLSSESHCVSYLATENALKVWKSSGKDIPEYCHLKTTFDAECQEYSITSNVMHINLVNSNDICVVCPADFNTVGKMVNGIADNVVTSTLAAWIGSGKPLYICEAMNNMMYANPFHLSNVEKLDNLKNVQFISPTVKKLACGDYGIGGLADIKTIANIVTGHRWVQPVKDADLIGGRVYEPNSIYGHYKIMPLGRGETFAEYLPKFNEPGAFGAKRKYDRHEGVDIYCQQWSQVYAVEDGEVVASYQYTGTKETGEWWNPTWCIKVNGKSGVVTYGELEMPDRFKLPSPFPNGIQYPNVGDKVKAGDFIGIVGQVLKSEKLRLDIRHHNTAMLHMELRTENCHLDGWKLSGDRDKKLLDPTPYLKMKDIACLQSF